MSILFQQARFLTSINHLSDLPSAPLPEVAFAGRSNAGKSSALNVLCRQKRLAFASKTPGRTQHINYFALGPLKAPSAHLVDLPGYGYANVPTRAKVHWTRLLGGYLQTRAQLRGLILLMDARRPCTILDCQMIKWFAPTGKPIHILLTKADKLTQQQRANTHHVMRKTLDESEAALMPDKLTVQLFSALTRAGVDAAEHLINGWLLCAQQ